MAEAPPQTPAVSWTEPEGLLARGTLILVPGRGEKPEVYERFGRRMSGDAYRVHVTADPVTDAALTESQVKQQLDGSGAPVPGPVVLVGSDTGALFAAGLLASGAVSGVDALILAGLPAADAGSSAGKADFDDELSARTTCPTHRGRLADGLVRPGALYEPVPGGWADRADLAKIAQPILGLHGTDDPVSPLSAVRARYAAAPDADLVSVTGTTHDALNNATHRTVAATVILFLERLRQGADLTPIAVREDL
jgi:alpha-beta hydrolase superfamily lysophospholipase